MRSVSPGLRRLNSGQRRDQHRAREERQRTDPEFGVGVAAMSEHVAGWHPATPPARPRLLQNSVRRRPSAATERAPAHEQFGAELLFQPADLMADRGRAERKVRAPRGESSVAKAARLERQQGGQRRDRRRSGEKRGFQGLNNIHLK